jgi:hypothetical protein
MSRTVYALLVGIDQYRPPIRSLRGCANDVRAIQALLEQRIVGTEDRLEGPRVLLNEDATRQAVIDGFRQYLANAREGDVVLFYYSGHGSQAQTPPEFQYLEPDRLDETLVCYDSRRAGQYDLADKELAKLIAEVAEQGPHIVVILDSCHSGSGTRAADTEGVRSIETDHRQRPVDSFIVSPAEARALSSMRTAAETFTDWAALPQGNHVLLAACRAEEEAKERFVEGEQRGVFSYFLIKTLQGTGESPTYRDLLKRVNALVRMNAARQSPQLEVIQVEDLDRPFLGGAIRPRSPYFTLSYDQEHGWVIDAGAVHGISRVTGEETTVLAIFPLDSNLEQVTDLSGAQGTARITQVLPGLSSVAVDFGEVAPPTPEMTYKAIVTSLPLPPLGVAVEGDASGVELARHALATAEYGQPSLYVREADPTAAELRLQAIDNSFRVARVAEDRPLVVDIAGHTERNAAKAIERLEHIARWMQIGRLSNPTSRIPDDAVRLEIFVVDESTGTGTALEDLAARGGEVRLEYRYRDGAWHEPQFHLKLTNTSDRRLYCTLLGLTETYAIRSNLLPGGGVWLEPGQAVWALGRQPIYASVPKRLWEQGVTEIKDLLKVIASTDQFDATLCEQDELDVSVARSALKKRVFFPSTLNRLMQRTQVRHFGSDPEENEAYADWTANELSFTTVRPLESVAVVEEGPEVVLGAGVTLAPHPSLKAQARLTSAVAAGREVGNMLLPPLLRDDPRVVHPFEFSASRNGEPGLSVLELSKVEDHLVVTPEQPLRLQVEAELRAGELILPIGYDYDGGFYLPLGFVRVSERHAEIELERLPAPESVRGVAGAIRIYFQKVVSTYLGAEYPYPLLAAAEIDEAGDVRYVVDADVVRTRIAHATRILLCTHGLLGDTRDMVASLYGSHGLAEGETSPIASAYDLILTFDYDSVNTPIEETARALKERLQAAGLGVGHGKSLHLAAHCIGGLVGRWFIEREGGGQVVDRLVLLGTPNLGTPWAAVQKWAGFALGIGLNSFGITAWPVTVLGGLVQLLERVDVTLDQIEPGSRFLQSLNASEGNTVPYAVIVGNAGLIASATEIDSNAGRSCITQLMERFDLEDSVRRGLGLVFFGQPNDLFVTGASGGTLPEPRGAKLEVEEVACDHVTYFSSEVARQAVRTGLGQRARCDA